MNTVERRGYVLQNLYYEVSSIYLFHTSSVLKMIKKKNVLICFFALKVMMRVTVITAVVVFALRIHLIITSIFICTISSAE